ncbi:MAG TPA: type II toxin-antitoxin system RelE/ParE family toxin [Tepidisphaeraceae bacterium]|jgi:toxin ParE1/3/4
MRGKVLKKPQVERDLITHFAFIAQDKIRPAERFLKVAQETFERLAAMPGMGREWGSALPHLAGIRVYPMPAGFRNYLIFYRPIENGIEVLTIMHGARDLELVLDALLELDQ